MLILYTCAYNLKSNVNIYHVTVYLAIINVYLHLEYILMTRVIIADSSIMNCNLTH